MKIYVSFLLVFVGLILSANDLVLISGKYKVAFSKEHHYSSVQYFYDNVEIGNKNGAYGTILATANNMFVGAFHTEGGVEKVVTTNLSCDGKNVEVASKTYSGEKIVFEKVSMLNNIKLFVRFTITPEEIRIDKNFEALGSQNIFSFYIFQHCWDNNTDKWLIGRPNKTFANGNFKSNEGWFLRGKENEILWYSLYNSNKNVGIVGYFAEYFPKQGTYMLWDRKVYHKFYFNATLPKVVNKGFKSKNYSLILKGYNATVNKWEDEAKKTAEKLEEKYPLAPLPKEISYENVSLQGNGKFNAKKLHIPAAPNSKYAIEFQIKKSPDVSEKIYQNYILIGQYDLNKKFEVIASFAKNTPKDNKFHAEKGTFSTPEKIYDLYVYIYNINSKGLVEVKDLKIKKIENKK